jgi:hypothetical protein
MLVQARSDLKIWHISVAASSIETEATLSVSMISFSLPKSEQ